MTFYSATRLVTAIRGRALVDLGSELVANFAGDWARTAVHSDLNVIGQTTTKVLVITGGADFAENFDVNAAPESNAVATHEDRGRHGGFD